jgi:hypothetical protein
MLGSDVLGLSAVLSSVSISLATLSGSYVPVGAGDAVTGDVSFPDVGSLKEGERDLRFLCSVPILLQTLL